MFADRLAERTSVTVSFAFYSPTECVTDGLQPSKPSKTLRNELFALLITPTMPHCFQSDVAMSTQNENHDNVQWHFRKSVPVKFIDHLIRRQEWVYAEARHQCCDNPLWSEPEARWMLGYTARSIFENELRKAAIASGLRVEDADHLGGNCSYVKVSAGNFRITAHRVPSPGSFVDPCESRRQDAAVNQLMDEYINEGLLCAPLPRIQQAKEIQIYLLHGELDNQAGVRMPFLELAAPDWELSKYQWQCSLSDLRQLYVADARIAGTETALEDRARPKPKQNKKQDRPEAENE